MGRSDDTVHSIDLMMLHVHKVHEGHGGRGRIRFKVHLDYRDRGVRRSFKGFDHVDSVRALSEQISRGIEDRRARFSMPALNDA